MIIFIFIVFLVPVIFLGYWYVLNFLIVFILILNIKIYRFGFYCNLRYIFGVDLFSYWFICLTLFFFCLIMLSRNLYNSFYIEVFILVCYFLTLFLYFVFSVINFLFIYIFFEFSLIPLLFLIFGLGYQPERFNAGFYLLLYTLFASLPLLLVILYLYKYNYRFFYDYFFGESIRFIFHFSIVFAFLVKFPIFIVHFWLPKAHVQASVSGSIILAGVLLKIGGYGLIRFIFLVENYFNIYGYVWYSLSLWGRILIRLICFCQGDIKCLIAYSSVSHMGICLIGLLRIRLIGLTGSFFLIIGHGLCSSGLFFLANICYNRLGRRRFFLNKGIIIIIPGISFIWFIFCCVNIRCPPRLNFFGEVFIIVGIINYWGLCFLYLVFISFFSACFRYYLFGYVQHGLFHGCYTYILGSVFEYFLLFIHMFPIFIIIFSLDLFIY